MKLRRPLALALGLVLVAGAGVAGAYPIWWGHRSAAQGHAVIARVRNEIAAHAEAERTAAIHGAPAPPCQAPVWPEVLQIPAIGLTAPVLDGTSDAILAVAVGHDPATAPPGPGGATVLVGHDVAWLARLDELHPGDEIDVTNECGRGQIYRVTGHVIARPGQQLPPGSGGELVLSTCWPLDALWWTDERFVVTAAWVGESSTTPAPTVASGVTIAVPPAAAGLELGDYPTPLGMEATVGVPPQGWNGESAWQLLRAAEQLWVAVHLFAGHDPMAWGAIAPGVPYPGAPLPTAGVVNVTFALSPTTIGAVVADADCALTVGAPWPPAGTATVAVVTRVRCG